VIFTRLKGGIYAEHIRDNQIVRRMYHTDIGRLLYGSGILGMFLYLIFSIKLFFLADLEKKTRLISIKRLRSVIFALAVINFALMVNGSLNLITLKSAIFLYIGALLRIYHITLKREKQKIALNGLILPVSQRVEV